MKRILLALVFLFSISSIMAQTSKEAESLFNDKQYEKALSVYKTLLTKNPQNVLYQYRYARCCYELNDNETAVLYFEKAGERYPLRNYYLGELYFKAYRFAESANSYQAFLSTLAEVDERIPYLNKQIETANLGAKLLNRVEDIVIVDSFFVDKTNFLEYYQLSSEVGVLKQHYQKIEGVETDIITYTNERKDRICYSDRRNGQMDLFTSQKLLEDWTKPQLLSNSINTPANENYPFFLSDGITLYYASDDKGGLGGYDIYITRYNAQTETYLAPENIGMPFNSTGNDYMMAIDENRNIGWFATDRNQIAGKIAIYTFIPQVEKKVINSEDKIYVANVAQLKTYKKAVLPFPQDKKILPKPPVEEDKTEFVFVIADEVVYTQYDDFKSPEALKKFKTYRHEEATLKQQETQLQEWRTRYAASSEAGKKSLTKKIIDLETQILHRQTVIEQEQCEIRNTEIKYLMNRKK